MRFSSRIWIQAWLGLALIFGATAAEAANPSFTNVTGPAGVGANQVPTYTHGFPAGGTVADFNNDGWQDIFLASGGGVPDKLFLNNGDGTFSNVAPAWGINAIHQSTSAVAGDYNNDGWQDLLVTAYTGNRLYENQGGTGFVNVAGTAGVAAPSPFGGAFGDYDLDGDLDLAVVTFDVSSGNRLYRNNGDGTFTNVTASSGVATALSGIVGFTVRFADMNGDRYPELLWIGDFGTSRYLRNNQNGTFTNITGAAGVGFDGTEMGHTVADFDRDGKFDWYVTTINTNNLYRNLGNHSYQEISGTSGVAITGWGWGTVSVDFNHDTKIDIAATSQSSAQYLFINQSPTLPGFLQFTPATAGFVSTVSGRGLSNLDYDNDGDQDIVIFPHSGQMQLFRNNVAGETDANWIRIFCDTSTEDDIAPNGIGAVVTVTTGTIVQMGRIDAGANYLSQSEMSAHFGLETATLIDEIRVDWPNGTSTTLFDVPVNQTLTISAAPPASDFVRSDANDDGAVNIADVTLSLNHIFLGDMVPCVAALDVNADGGIDVSDVTSLIGYIFNIGNAPSAPFPSCGPDPSATLGCDTFATCP